MFRPSHAVVGALALIAAACYSIPSDSNSVPISTATVRLVNDTDVPLALNNAGIVDSLNARLVFGQASACVLVNLSNRTVPVLTITNGAAGARIFFTPPLSAGANLLVVGFIGFDGTVQFATLDNRVASADASARLRFFNGVASTGPLVMARSGAVLTPFIGLGTASGFVSVPTDSAAITFSNRSSVVLDAGPMAFPLGQSSTVLVGPSAPGTAPLRSFPVQGC
jgi:hypothetical protein